MVRGWLGFAVVLVCLSACGADETGSDEPALRRGSARRGATSSGSNGAAANGSSGSSDSLVGTGDDFHELCWSTINEYRKRDGLPPLERWTAIESCSDGESADDAASNKGHGSFPRCGELAQNECPDTPGEPADALVECLAMMWAEGPGGGHHDAMASTQYTKVACGLFETSRGTIWSVQNFR